MLQHPLGLADAITLVLLFLLAVFLLGILVGLAHLWWRTRRDRLPAQKGDGGSANARPPEPGGGRSRRSYTATEGNGRPPPPPPGTGGLEHGRPEATHRRPLC